MSARASKKLAELQPDESGRPAWIDEALAASIGYVNETLCGGKMISPRRYRQAKGSRCFCCGMPVEILLERSGRGLLAGHEHILAVRRLFKRFAVTCPSPADYAEAFLRAVVPAHNIMFSSRRWCLECGKEFELNSPTEKMSARHCSSACTSRGLNPPEPGSEGAR